MKNKKYDKEKVLKYISHNKYSYEYVTDIQIGFSLVLSLLLVLCGFNIGKDIYNLITENCKLTLMFFIYLLWFIISLIILIKLIIDIKKMEKQKDQR